MLQAAQRIDDFEIIRPLGKGGMGEVYEAQQLNPSRRVALKVLAPWLTQDEDSLSRFRREVEVLAQLDHPGIVHVITTGRTPEGIVFYTMKLIRGISLSELLRTASQAQGDTRLVPTKSQLGREHETPSVGGPIEVFNEPDSAAGSPMEIVREYVANRHAFVVRVGISAARALSAAHQQGHLHRDIKPSNLMIDHHGQLYLVDFGLTRALDPGANVSCDGFVRGTPWYMSPEQARGESIDQQSDIYSLGVTLFELLTGGMGPYTASRDDSVAVLQQVKAGMHLPLRVLAPDIPRELEQVILRSIQLKRKRRYQQAADLAADLERIMPSASGLITPSKRKPVPAPRSPWKWIVPAAAVAALFLSLGLTWRAWWPAAPREESTEPPIQGTNVTITTKPSTADDTEPLATRDDYPEGLRNPTPKTVVQLLTTDNLPVWPNRRLLGDGFQSALPNELIVNSTAGSHPTLIALGDSTRTDPDRPWFEFSVELRHHAASDPKIAQVGVFWGQRDPRERIQCFSAQLDTHPVLKDVHGRVKVGWSLIQLPDATAGRNAINAWMLNLPQGKGFLSLPKPDPKAAGWHKVTVRVLEQEITVTVDDGPSVFFTGRILKDDQFLKGDSLDPRGHFGIWVRNGQGSFRNATFVPLSGR